MGTNACHDSAWLANLIATDRFAPVRDRYEIVFADIGMPHIEGRGRSPEVPARFGFTIRGTPTVAILDAEGHVLNRRAAPKWRSDEHTSELQSLMRISYAVFCLNKKKQQQQLEQNTTYHNKYS